MSKQAYSKINWAGIVSLLIFYPILLVILVVLGILNLSYMLSILTNLVAISLVLLMTALFYYAEKLSITTIVFTGVIVGFIIWVIGLVVLLSGTLSFVCSIPFVGTAICGGITVVSLFTSLPGFLLGGVLLSGIIGGMLLLLTKK